MLDIHSHLVFGVDDGSNSIEESIRMVETAKKNGIDTIIATPHFQNGIFNNDGVFEKFEILVERTADYNIDIRLGNEVLADEKIINIIKAKNCKSFDNSKSILIELPYNVKFEYVARLIHKITATNIKVIIAHPERNRKIIKNFREFISLIHATNCQVQVDAGSIIGVYGVLVKDVARQLLKTKEADFVASNAHCPRDYMTIYPTAVSKIYQLYDEEYAMKLLESNSPEIVTIEGGPINYGREIG